MRLVRYVRALLKLGLGMDFCERMGFTTKPLQSYVGFRTRDIGEKETITGVHYLERSESQENVRWKIAKSA